MKYRRLGKTNLQISEISMGTWQIADDPEWGKGPEEKDSFKVLQRYIDLGGNSIDTAWVYGWSEDKPKKHLSEELIGRFLQQTSQRSKVILTTKIPPLNQMWPISKDSRIENIFPKKHIIDCIEDSLRSLQTDCLDVVLFHVWLDTFNENDEWKEVCQRLTSQGKVKFWGLSPNYYDPAGCLKTLESGEISVVQCIFNIFHQKPITDLFPTAKRLDIGVTSCAPFDEGGLTGKLHKGMTFPHGDFRAQYFAGSRLDELDRRISQLTLLLEDEATTIPEMALRYILSFDEVSSVIPGMRNIDYVKANIDLSDGRKLSKITLKELKRHSWERNFYPWATE
ncbi:aldo/keto reductase [Candidatus Roizmanbacteria bacterium CG_4_9_14_0_2_um_filter_39_13]|uniref:Aldo/keto reductase n=2 Tax=Candidatus Roizmaniibacteriota TaxID=1752723 RepID=A0A2M8EYJ8_9BACT|nr:MAG: aldo/keto reductase [Candidatus Roizmanbacteria bacterium CG_4_10_14_0_2_um_filter_39_12]PJC31606.1 MAG: aldo/keto reductase [Candidatus Roizmanbacteria bacterium CG_4_9_14_0_2_um_filter_39_13]PJE61948.1 MAG: aldo/keto reductase [Candidatus Roizmanbacteria bacterium CG10_big_fil_rev_8_21_14_0_10_39_12]